ncbi:MAG TPA: FecR domain-containing protein [Verrucomicrobiae bacterium]|nr:FecR domain-containing protein [Verrucomicrobiae bacterium]
MNLESNPMDPALEQAMSEIREETVDDAVVEAAAARVWANLSHAQAHAPLRTCADFQALLPDYKAGRLPGARAMLVKDHLHECVACRKVYEGKVVTMPVAAPRRRANPTVRWAIAAAVVAAAGLSVWVAVDQYGNRTGHAFVQALNGTLYEITPNGIQALALNQDLPDGVEIRTAKDSDAVLQLKDGSTVEMRERSGFTTSQSARDLTVRLSRGSVIVQAAHRSSGHLFVVTPDCRVAVTGTVFSVTSGVKGSRVSVIQGEVRVSQDNQDKLLHPGDQTVTSPSLEPVSVKDDISWSRNRDTLVRQLESLKAGLASIQLPKLRYSSKLLGRLPAGTVFFASIPNLADYLGQTQTVLNQKMAESPELRAWSAGNTARMQTILEKLRAASEYLGDEIAVFGFNDASGKAVMPVFLAEVKRDGLADFLKKENLPLTIEQRNGLVAFGPDANAIASFAQTLDSPAGTFTGTPFYQRISESYRNGAGLLLSADLSQMGEQHTIGGARYFIAEEKQVDNQMEMRASLGFEGLRTGMAAWLAAPAPMGALDYISPEATIVMAFVVRNPGAILDEVVGMQQRSPAAAQKVFADAKIQTGIDIRTDLAAALGGEFSLSLDGPAIPVPSWKLVVEVYDPARMQATLSKFVQTYNDETVKRGGQPLRVGQEVFEGRTYYMIGGPDGSPLTEGHYTFADGYMIAGPSRALVSRALQVKTAGTSIARSAQFVAMEPRDHYSNFSALIYQNLGTTLAPITSLLGAFAGRGGANGNNPLDKLGNMKPMMIAAYGEPDRINVASTGDLMGLSPANLVTGNIQNAIPFTQFMGTPRRVPAFK